MKAQAYAIPVLIIIAALLAFALIPRDEFVFCTQDAKMCPDGSSVGRVPPRCEFAACPGEKVYIGNSPDECSRIRFLCVPGTEAFEDEKGCGCQKTGEIYCTPESRNAEACIEIYQPVCGWFDPAKIQCIKYPCAQTYSNGCFACHNSDVLYYTEGECPI